MWINAKVGSFVAVDNLSCQGELERVQCQFLFQVLKQVNITVQTIASITTSLCLWDLQLSVSVWANNWGLKGHTKASGQEPNLSGFGSGL